MLQRGFLHQPPGSYPALALNILFKKHVLPVVHGVCELCYPVAEDKHTRLLGQLQVKLYVPVAVDEEVDIRMAPDVFLGV